MKATPHRQRDHNGRRARPGDQVRCAVTGDLDPPGLSPSGARGGAIHAARSHWIDGSIWPRPPPAPTANRLYATASMCGRYGPHDCPQHPPRSLTGTAGSVIGLLERSPMRVHRERSLGGSNAPGLLAEWQRSTGSPCVSVISRTVAATSRASTRWHGSTTPTSSAPCEPTSAVRRGAKPPTVLCANLRRRKVSV